MPSALDQPPWLYISQLQHHVAFPPHSDQLPLRPSAAPPIDLGLVHPHTLCERGFYETHSLCHVRAHIQWLRARPACYRSVGRKQTAYHIWQQLTQDAAPIHSRELASPGQVIRVLRAACQNTNRTDATRPPPHILPLTSRPQPGRHNTM